MGSDIDTTIQDLRDEVGQFVAKRSWQRFHSPRNLVTSIAVEAAELLELYQWNDPADAQQASNEVEIAADDGGLC